MSSLHPYLVQSATAKEFQEAKKERSGRGALTLLGMLRPTVSGRQALGFIRRSSVPDMISEMHEAYLEFTCRNIGFDSNTLLMSVALSCDSFRPQIAKDHLRNVVAEWTADMVYQQDFSTSNSGDTLIALPTDVLYQFFCVSCECSKLYWESFGKDVGDRLVHIYVSTRTHHTARRLYANEYNSSLRWMDVYILQPLAECGDIDLQLLHVDWYKSLVDTNRKSMAAREATIARCNYWRLRTLRSCFPMAADDLTALVGTFLGASLK